jgi:hypothetical protein
MYSLKATVLMLIAISVIAIDTVSANRLIGLIDSATAQQPDLVPVDDQGNPPMGQDPKRYCQRENNYARLVVAVKNQGNAPAEANGPSPMWIEVQLMPGGERIKEMIEDVSGGRPIIQPGETVRYAIPNSEPDDIPECYNPECDFLIKVDPGHRERDEVITHNNSTHGQCPNPSRGIP